MNVEIKNREHWLAAAAEAILPIFHDAGVEEVPAFRVSVGFPKARGKKAHGQCWVSDASSDGVCQVFVHPELGEDPTYLVAVLMHEMIHVIDDCKNGHTGRFREIAREVGMEGKLTSTHASGALAERIDELVGAAGIGDYPHAVLNTDTEVPGIPKKQSTRMIKLVCPSCEMIIRTSKKWIEEVGAPTCLDGSQFEIEEANE